MEILVQLVVLLFSIIVHEYAHGWVAEKCGDDTARSMGRLTSNPLPHIDLFGTIFMPAFCVIAGAPPFGWAKPVPVNSRRLRNPSKDRILISLAGPGANLLLALVASGGILAAKNIGFVGPDSSAALFELCKYVLVINIILALFNLIPLPPLDGGKVLSGILPKSLSSRFLKIEPYSFLIIFVLFYSGVMGTALGPIMSLLIKFLGAGL